MITRHIREHGFDLRLGVELKEILDDGTGKVKGSNQRRRDHRLSVGWPHGRRESNIEFVKSSKIVCGRGIIVNQFQQTNINGVCRQRLCPRWKHPRRPTAH